MIDDLNNSKESEKFLSDLIQGINPKINFKIITTYNWGGTIVGLWVSYNYAKNTYNGDCYLAMFEEDFHPIAKNDNTWLEDSINLLTDDIIYVGETNTGKLKSDPNRILNSIYKNSISIGNPELWTDGGYYFSNINKLKIIENKIGIFHKGNQTTKYDHINDGIDIGEVGFPTLIHNEGLKFTCLYRINYFIHDE